MLMCEELLTGADDQRSADNETVFHDERVLINEYSKIKSFSLKTAREILL
jgi:hypothetical protein